MPRVAFWADDELDKRLDALLERMKDAPALRDVDVTKSAVIKAAIRRGLPFLELDYGSRRFGGAIGKDELVGWIDTTINELLEWADTLDLDLPGFPRDK